MSRKGKEGGRRSSSTSALGGEDKPELDRPQARRFEALVVLLRAFREPLRDGDERIDMLREGNRG